jgi:hypothetical protein
MAVEGSAWRPPVHPFRWVPRGVRWYAFFIFLAIALAVLAMFQLWVNLTTTKAPHGMISLQLAGTLARAREILASWHTQGLDMRAGFNDGVDYAFIVGYVGFGAIMAGGTADHFARTRVPTGILRGACRAMVAAAWMILVAGALDATEDVFLFRLMDGHVTIANVHGATYPATVKFALAVLATVAYVVAFAFILLSTKKKHPIPSVSDFWTGNADRGSIPGRSLWSS